LYAMADTDVPCTVSRSGRDTVWGFIGSAIGEQSCPLLNFLEFASQN
jgi:hypothetical protein